MGYSTSFDGTWKLDRPLAPEHATELREFNETRHEDYSPGGKPGLYCQWVPTEDGTAIEWDEGEKFYDYIPWARYLVEHFIGPWGYKLNGVIEWDGESQGDTGRLKMLDNVLTIQRATLTFQPDDET